MLMNISFAMGNDEPVDSGSHDTILEAQIILKIFYLFLLTVTFTFGIISETIHHAH